MNISFIVKNRNNNLIYPDKKVILNLKKYLKDECILNGSSFKGRIDSFKYLTDSKQKPCILISLEKKIMLMPIFSLKSETNYLINYFMIHKIVYKDYNCTMIEFINGDQVQIDVNNRIIKKQYDRCLKFINKIYFN